MSGKAKGRTSRSTLGTSQKQAAAKQTDPFSLSAFTLHLSPV